MARAPVEGGPSNGPDVTAGSRAASAHWPIRLRRSRGWRPAAPSVTGDSRPPSHSGIRWGEAVALRRQACDLLRRQLRIEESATEIGGHLSWGLPKTHRRRAVSVPRFVADDLAAHLASEVPADPEALVFTVGGFGPVRHGDFLRYRWRPAVKAAELPAGLTPHELRHTAASLLIAGGAGPKSIQTQLGHSTITTTFDVYGHLFEGHLDEVMDRLDDDWRRASA